MVDARILQPSHGPVPAGPDDAAALRRELAIVRRQLAAAQAEAARGRRHIRRHAVVFEACHDPVVLNLLINASDAVLEQPTQRIRLSTRVTANIVVLEVTDTGPGIPDELIPRIFSPFFSTKGVYAPDGSPQAGISGTGLGLSVSHTIATAHGGDIQVRGGGDRGGATFQLSLPREPSSGTSPTRSPPESPRGAGRRVLVVEDEEDITDMLALLLGQWGFAVQTTADGQDALERAAVETFDVALVDLQMPKMPGREVVRRLVRLPPERQPRIIIMSGDTSPEVTAELRKLGVTRFLYKPFDMVELGAQLHGLDRDG